MTALARFSRRCLPHIFNRVFGAIALNALDIYAISTPWLHQDTTTITLYGAYEEEARLVAGLVPPRPAYGHSKDGRDDLKQVLLSLGVSSEGLPLRMGVRDGNTSDSTETPVAIEEYVALGLDGVRGIVADSKAYCKRTLGLCLEQRRGADHVGPAHVCRAAGVGGVGPAAGPVAFAARKAWPDTPGAATALAWAQCRPPGGSGIR